MAADARPPHRHTGDGRPVRAEPSTRATSKHSLAPKATRALRVCDDGSAQLCSCGYLSAAAQDDASAWRSVVRSRRRSRHILPYPVHVMPQPILTPRYWKTGRIASGSRTLLVFLVPPILHLLCAGASTKRTQMDDVVD
jgi:hypothetical protein